MKSKEIHSRVINRSGDLFPALDVPRKRDLDFEAMVKTAAIDLKLQADEGFILKVRYARVIISDHFLIDKR